MCNITWHTKAHSAVENFVSVGGNNTLCTAYMRDSLIRAWVIMRGSLTPRLICFSKRMNLGGGRGGFKRISLSIYALPQNEFFHAVFPKKEKVEMVNKFQSKNLTCPSLCNLEVACVDPLKMGGLSPWATLPPTIGCPGVERHQHLPSLGSCTLCGARTLGKVGAKI